MSTTHTITSADGATMRTTDAPTGGSEGTAILVGGAISYWKFPEMVEPAEQPVGSYGLTVISYGESDNP